MLNINNSKLANNPTAWRNGAKYWNKQVSKIQGKERITSDEINHIQNQLANIHNIVLNDKMQYDSTVGGNIYDSSAAQAYYMAGKRAKYNDKILHKQEADYSNKLSSLNTQLNNAEYNEQYDNEKAQELVQEREQHTSEWISILIAAISMIVMFI